MISPRGSSNRRPNRSWSWIKFLFYSLIMRRSTQMTARKKLIPLCALIIPIIVPFKLIGQPDAQGPHQVLWYQSPGPIWDHALPVGNGRLGAMVFGGANTVSY